MCANERKDCDCAREKDCECGCGGKSDVCEALRRAKKCTAQAECALAEVKSALREIEKGLKKPRCQCVQIDPIC
jgi:hypothetical protein